MTPYQARIRLLKALIDDNPDGVAVLGGATKDCIDAYVTAACADADSETVFKDALADLADLLAEEQALAILFVLAWLFKPILAEALDGSL
ncbi:hypothetical protein [Methylopila sp. M107]|uniref:hypothetical protein n=1 Tax=Methylopila sp. M107 TaxID=1101190 RepID=UPI0003685FFE|nr:hypothetical protein [Methylopila sp. M107]